MTRAYMRVLGSEETELAIVPLSTPGAICVEVPAFGHLIAVAGRDTCILTHGPGTETTRPIASKDGRLECELLHKADMLCVVIEP